MSDKRVALLERALHQIKNGCVDEGDEANALFRSAPCEIRKIATDALAGVGEFALEPETTVDENTGLDVEESDRGSVFAVPNVDFPAFTITGMPDATVHAFPGHVCCSKCTQPLAFQERKTGETHAICWCTARNCEMYDVRLVLESQPYVVRRFEG